MTTDSFRDTLYMRDVRDSSQPKIHVVRSYQRVVSAATACARCAYRSRTATPSSSEVFDIDFPRLDFELLKRREREKGEEREREGREGERERDTAPPSRYV